MISKGKIASVSIVLLQDLIPGRLESSVMKDMDKKAQEEERWQAI